MVVVDIVDEAEQHIDKWMGDTGYSHHIKSTREGRINMISRNWNSTSVRRGQGGVHHQEEDR